MRDALNAEFADLIDLHDVTNPDPGERERAFCSRALAALVVRDRTGCDSEAAASAVTDGRDDHGIDAVGIGDSVPHLWLVQAKWHHRGEAGLKVADALKMIEGLKKLDHHDYSRLNDKLQGLEGRIKTVLNQRHARVTLVVVLMGADMLSDDVRQRFEEAAAEFNGFGAMLDYQVCRSPELWEIIRKDFAPPVIDLTVKMDKWYRVDTPFSACSGTVSVGEIADWYESYGDQLFTHNIRKHLGLTSVNHGLVETLVNDPHNFLYYNNGITLLCDRFVVTPRSRSAPHGPIDLEVAGASVVNGAQTVAATLAAMRRDPAKAGEAYVGVRVISTENGPEELPVEITKATNTQNHVERRDFVALDPVQSAIREDFAISLQKLYTIQRGELDPPPAAGCSVVQAAIALACAHANPELAVRAKRDHDLLWEDGPRGAYRLLFGDRPTAAQIWRSVLLLRAVQSALHGGQDRRQGRAAAIAEHGDLLLAHVVFHHVGLDAADDSDEEWDSSLAGTSDTVDRALAWLIYHVDREFGSTSFIGNTFSNPARCRILVSKVLADLRAGAEVPALPAGYQPAKPPPRARRRNTVSLIVDAGRIKDGTILTFAPRGKAERLALEPWLVASPNRARASWVNSRSKPLLWAEDGVHYSPSGLVTRIWAAAEWDAAPVAVQGTLYWSVAGEGSLLQIAESILRQEEPGMEDGPT